jgi:hypothetical protein
LEVSRQHHHLDLAFNQSVMKVFKIKKQTF